MLENPDPPEFRQDTHSSLVAPTHDNLWMINITMDGLEKSMWLSGLREPASVAFNGISGSSLIGAFVCVGIVVALVWLLDTTDVPYIKGLPSVPALPIIGNLVQLGTEQPRRLAEAAQTHGPVFQIRLGNKVCHCRTYTLSTD